MVDRRPTIKDVAALAGISKGMVSLALRGAPGPSAVTTARVLAAAEELGYRADRAASTLALRRSRLLGVTMTVRNVFHAELVEGVQDAAVDAGYEVVLSAVTGRRGERAAVETLLDSRCEAVLLLGPELPTEDLLQLDRRTPVVVVGRRTGRPDLDGVRIADVQGMALAVDHLADLGHRHLLHVTGGSGDIARDRREGFLRAAERRGLTAQVVEGSFADAEASGSRAAAGWLADPAAATGLVAANDRIALGFLDSLGRAGVAVPGELSVVGFDDSLLAQLGHVQLTSISQEPHEMARRAVAAAIERLDGGRTEHHDVVLEPRLVVRSTTASVGAGGRVPAVESSRTSTQR